MNNGYKKLFIFLVIFLLCLPLTHFLGTIDKTKIYGVEQITELSDITEKSFIKKQIQPVFEAWWNSHFAFRKIMLKLKNQIYDWMNFGVIHSRNTVIQGKKGYLYSRQYFQSYCKKCLNIPNSLNKIKNLENNLNKKGIELFFVLAPQKVVTYFDLTPLRYRYFLGGSCEYYEKIEDKLQKMGIKVFNSQRLVSKIRKNEKYQPFSKTGTHWNYYGAGRVVQETSSFFGWKNVKIKDVMKRDNPYKTERDIANLLNLIIKYKSDEKFYRPIYEKIKPLKGKSTIIGNSFSNEFVANFYFSGLALYKDIFHFENSPLMLDDISLIKQSKRVIFIYTDIDIVNEESQFYKKMDFLLNHLDDSI